MAALSYAIKMASADRWRVNRMRSALVIPKLRQIRKKSLRRTTPAKGLPFQFSSRVLGGHEPRTSSIILVDQMGLLFDLYALGDLSFCGGTLEPLGGHNILEPAAWGKVVFYGPHVDRVLAEHHSLQASGAGIVVKDGRELLHQWRSWLPRLKELRDRAGRARAAVSDLGGVAARHVELILDALTNSEANEHNKDIV